MGGCNAREERADCAVRLVGRSMVVCEGMGGWGGGNVGAVDDEDLEERIGQGGIYR